MEHEQCWVLENDKEELIGLDRNSGGYPYVTKSLRDTEFWYDYMELQRYQKSFPELKIRTFRWWTEV